MLLANENYQHRPTADSRYDALSDASWHELVLTFVVTSQEPRTLGSTALPLSGALHWQITGVSLRSVHDVPKTATATDHAKFQAKRSASTALLVQVLMPAYGATVRAVVAGAMTRDRRTPRARATHHSMAMET